MGLGFRMTTYRQSQGQGEELTEGHQDTYHRATSTIKGSGHGCQLNTLLFEPTMDLQGQDRRRLFLVRGAALTKVHVVGEQIEDAGERLAEKFLSMILFRLFLLVLPAHVHQ